MAKKAQKLPRLNFIPKDPFFESSIGKVMVWSLKVGRYIVIFTELIVIISFGTRFKLDRDLTDLNSNIVAKTAIVASYGNLEEQIRLIQKKSEIITDLIDENDSLQLWEKLLGLIPAEVKLTRLHYQPSELQISGTALSSRSFSDLVQRLQRDPQLGNLTIDQINSGDNKDPGINFIIRIAIANKKTKSAVQSQPNEEEPEL